MKFQYNYYNLCNFILTLLGRDERDLNGYDMFNFDH